MLNEADGHGGEASEVLKDADALYRRLKRDVKADYNSEGQVNWRREAREDFDFEAGERGRQGDFAGRKASDRHFQPRRNHCRLRFRSGNRQPVGSAISAAAARCCEEKRAIDLGREVVSPAMQRGR
jgi:hypothetical protein